MSITAITLENFKGIGTAVRVELRPITLLFGANSAGKSTILQALLYAREILERGNTDPDTTLQGGSAVDLGGFRNLVHQHDVSLPIRLRFDLDLEQIDLVDHGDFPDSEDLDRLSGEAMSAWVQLTITWGRLQDEPVQTDFETGINGMGAVSATTEGSSRSGHRVRYNGRHPWLGEYEPDADDGGAESEAEWIDCPTADFEARPRGKARRVSLFDEVWSVLGAHELGRFKDVIEFALIAPGEYLRSQLTGLRYLGPVRVVPDRRYQPCRSPDESRWASGLAAWDWIHGASFEQLEGLNQWLTWKQRLNTGYRVELRRFKELDVEGMAGVALSDDEGFPGLHEAIRAYISGLPVKTRVLLRQERDFLEVAPQDIGIGISQVIPVVVAALAQKDGVVAIEQPELHIHPAVQVALGDLFIQQCAASEGFDRQFLIETHSEHLLLRLLRRVRETGEGQAPEALRLTPERVAVYYVEADAGGTQLKRIRINEEGRFDDRWPHGFFEERETEYFGEAVDMSEEMGRLFGS